MRLLRFWRHTVVAAFTFAALQVFQVHFLQEALQRQNQDLVIRLQSSIAEVLNEAHKTKDDLTLYHVTHALKQSPGVLEAQVLKFQQPGYPLGDWGRLHLVVSDRFTSQLIDQQGLIAALIFGLLTAMTALYLYKAERRDSQFRARLNELQGLLEAEKRQFVRSEERERLAGRQGMAALNQALKRLPEPLVILNVQQRIWAINEAAISRLHITGAVLEKSWHEIPALESCGPVLEQSLAAPGKAVDWSDPTGGLRLRFETAPDTLSGTWIWVDRS